jgi:hypothetical protein
VKGQHEAVRTVADRQKTQTFRQEGKQLGVLVAAISRKTGYRRQATGRQATGRQATGRQATERQATGRQRAVSWQAGRR